MIPAPATRNPRLSLTVQYAVKPAEAPTRAQFRKWARAALGRDAEITLRIVGEEEGRVLNRDYRGKDYATNVLTFGYGSSPGGRGALTGDIVLCAPVVAREAAMQGKSVEAHFAHLTVHGVLHLQGHDHESDGDARVMEGLESQIVTKLGYPDPYRGDE
jgi:probable rRNA maturation factor